MKTNKEIIEEARSKQARSERRWIIAIAIPLFTYVIFAFSTLCYLIWLENSEKQKDKIWLEKSNEDFERIDAQIMEVRRILDSLENQ